jgi:hypothetical protein
MNLRDIFLRDKEEDAGGLTPGKDDDAVSRKKIRKGITVLDSLGYI